MSELSVESRKLAVYRLAVSGKVVLLTQMPTSFALELVRSAVPAVLLAATGLKRSAALLAVARVPVVACISRRAQSPVARRLLAVSSVVVHVTTKPVVELHVVAVHTATDGVPQLPADT